jgi:hypothetical protein
VIVWVPTESVVLNDPAPPLSVAAPIDVWPSRNVTLPVGVPVPVVGATFTFRVMFCPLVTCVPEAETDVTVEILAAAATVTEVADDVEEEKFESPE